MCFRYFLGLQTFQFWSRQLLLLRFFYLLQRVLLSPWGFPNETNTLCIVITKKSTSFWQRSSKVCHFQKILWQVSRFHNSSRHTKFSDFYRLSKKWQSGYGYSWKITYLSRTGTADVRHGCQINKLYIQIYTILGYLSKPQFCQRFQFTIYGRKIIQKYERQCKG